MSENTPSTPGDALPPKPAEAKVQPRKETVRISLPPKPTASPTIKLPSLPGAPTAASSSPSPSVTLPAGAPSAPPAPPVKTAAAPAAKVAGATVAKPTAAPSGKPGAPVPAPKPVSAPKPPSTVGVFDKVLAVFSLVVSLAAVGTVIFLMTLLDKTQGLLDEIVK